MDDLFKTYIKNIKPLKTRNKTISPPIAPLKSTATPASTSHNHITPPPSPTKPAFVITKTHALPSIHTNTDRSIARKIQTKKIIIESTLDLHGFTNQQAYDRLRCFLETCVQKNIRWVRIITGKGIDGKGVIRTNLPKWVNTPAISPFVVTLMPAAITDGGQGAFYIFLRAKRKM